jgi:hypothetical protein
MHLRQIVEIAADRARRHADALLEELLRELLDRDLPRKLRHELQEPMLPRR